MISLKKLFLVTCSVIAFCCASSSEAMSRDQKATVASFAHNHPIITSFVPNFFAFRCILPYKKQPIRRFGAFTAATAIGAGFAQFFGHDYLKRNNYPHHPKMYTPICSNSCSVPNSEGFNQKAVSFLSKTYDNLYKAWNS